jgi:hypothetical protein
MATAQQATQALKDLSQAYRDFLQLAHDALAPDATPEEREVMREQIKLFLDEPEGNPAMPQGKPAP